MNRIQFIGLTHAGNNVSIESIIKFFDHMIAAYDIVRDVEPIAMQSSTDDLHSSLKIQIESPDASKLDGVVSYINDTIHNHKNVYGRNFSVNAKSNNKNEIELFVRSETL